MQLRLRVRKIVQISRAGYPPMRVWRNFSDGRRLTHITNMILYLTRDTALSTITRHTHWTSDKSVHNTYRNIEMYRELREFDTSYSIYSVIETLAFLTKCACRVCSGKISSRNHSVNACCSSLATCSQYDARKAGSATNFL